MPLLTGLTPDGLEVPVQVKPDGKLVAEGLTGPVGSVGPEGAKGDTGAQGPAGPSAQISGTAALPGLTPIGDPNTGLFSPGPDQLAWSTSGVERARLDPMGRLLLGASTSVNALLEAGLQVHGIGASAYIGSFRWSNNTNRSEIVFGKSRGAVVGTRAVVLSDDSLGGVTFTGDDGAKFVTAAQIVGQVDGTPGANDMPGRLVFSTTADGAAGSAERVRINSSGNVGIGTTAPVYKLAVVGDAHVSGALVLRSPDGNHWRVTISDAGVLATSRVAALEAKALARAEAADKKEKQREKDQAQFS